TLARTSRDPTGTDQGYGRAMRPRDRGGFDATESPTYASFKLPGRGPGGKAGRVPALPAGARWSSKEETMRKTAVLAATIALVTGIGLAAFAATGTGKTPVNC